MDISSGSKQTLTIMDSPQQINWAEEGPCPYTTCMGAHGLLINLVSHLLLVKLYRLRWVRICKWLFTWQHRVLWAVAEVSQPQGACPRGDKLPSLGTESKKGFLLELTGQVFSGSRSGKRSETCPCNAAKAPLLGWLSPAQRRVVGMCCGPDTAHLCWELGKGPKPFCGVGHV